MISPSISEYSSYEVLRPGFTRLNLPWFASDEEIDFVLEAVALTCELAWKLMPQYRVASSHDIFFAFVIF